uniref:Uncharacterized protein n=1 Tax=Rhizophora mucronata TaxID=61149 RepID=A0A2P2N5L4_RHIMU
MLKPAKTRTLSSYPLPSGLFLLQNYKNVTNFSL